MASLFKIVINNDNRWGYKYGRALKLNITYSIRTQAGNELQTAASEREDGGGSPSETFLTTNKNTWCQKPDNHPIYFLLLEDPQLQIFLGL
jgi:hypothetical protein